MRLVTGLLFTIMISVALVSAQEPTSAAAAVETLRAQLVEVQTKETDLQARARQLDEALKPENIEHSLAGIGSTRPEELREQRRRQLTIERDGVLAQLKILATSRERLEASIRTAEAIAYQKSAEGNATLLGQTAAPQSARWLVLTLAGVVGILALAAIVFLTKRNRNA